MLGQRHTERFVCPGTAVISFLYSSSFSIHLWAHAIEAAGGICPGQMIWICSRSWPGTSSPRDDHIMGCEWHSGNALLEEIDIFRWLALLNTAQSACRYSSPYKSVGGGRGFKVWHIAKQELVSISNTHTAFFKISSKTHRRREAGQETLILVIRDRAGGCT
jgi:hypothetical protein